MVPPPSQQQQEAVSSSLCGGKYTWQNLPSCADKAEETKKYPHPSLQLPSYPQTGLPMG